MISTLFAGNNRQFEGNVHAPEFPGNSQWLNTDQPMALAELQGKFVLLDFWTYCCINCMHILPDLAKLEDEYKDELVVVGVHSAKFENEGETQNIREAIARYDIHHPVVNDRDFHIWRSYGVHAWPTIVLIAPNGNIIVNESGEGVYNRLKPVLDNAVKYWKEKGKLNTIPFAYAVSDDRDSLLYFPGKVFFDPDSRTLILSNSNRHQILIVNADSGELAQTIGNGQKGRQDGDFQSASFNKPQGIFRRGDIIYVADTENHLIRKIDLKSEKVTTILGTGEQAKMFNRSGYGVSVAINSPWDIHQVKDDLYIAMAGFHQIWRMQLRDGYAEPFAGSGFENIVDGRLLQSQMAQPSGITFDGEYLYVADSETSSLRRISLSDESHAVKTLIGAGLFEFGDVEGTYPSARLQHPLGLYYFDGKIYIADTYNNKIKTFDLKTGLLKSWGNISLNEPSGLTADGKYLYITDTNNHRLIRTGLTSRTWQEFYIKTNQPLLLHPDAAGNLLIELVLPKGTKINPEVNSMIHFGGNTVMVKDAKLKILKENLQDKTGSMMLYYCDDGGRGLCYFQEISMILRTEKISESNKISVNKPK